MSDNQERVKPMKVVYVTQLNPKQQMPDRHTQMWHSQVEIEHYSVAYFARIAAFKRSSVELPLRAGVIRAV